MEKGYTTKKSPGGYTLYFLNGKRIPKKDVPKDVLDRLTVPEGTPKPETPKSTQKAESSDTDEWDGVSPKGYTYIATGKNRTYYYNGKRILKSKIPKDAEVRDFTDVLNEQYEKERRQREETWRRRQVEEAKKRAEEAARHAETMRRRAEEVRRQAAETRRRAEGAKGPQYKTAEEAFRDFIGGFRFNTGGGGYSQRKPSPPPPVPQSPSHWQLLQREKIYSRADWKKWMLRNHPDKNPHIDSELVAAVNAAVAIYYPK